MPHVTEPAIVSFALLEEPRFRISGGGTRVVNARLSLEIHRRILAASSRRLTRAILRHRIFVGGPGANQRAIDGEMLIGSQLPPLGQDQDLAAGLAHDDFL